jgi:8-oxo-dGTP diphosphatase
LKNLPREGKHTQIKFKGRTATAIIEFPNDKILLVKRGTVPFRDYWALPGGKVEVGETVEQTVVREVKEETGLVIKIVQKIGEYHEYGVQGGIEYDYYPACFLVRPVGRSIERQKTEIEGISLFDLRNIPKTLAFVHSSMVDDYLRQRQVTEPAKEP